MSTQPSTAADLAERLARNAEAVCQTYLSAGRRHGRWWLVGDVRNTPGRSLYVRLQGPPSGKGAAGKWADAATGEHGDLLDVIALAKGLTSIRDALQEARAFLSLPRDTAPVLPQSADHHGRPRDTAGSARRLFARSEPLAGTRAAAYLRHRGIAPTRSDARALRFRPNCFYREHAAAEPATFPALVAAVTDGAGHINGVHRTWLHPTEPGAKAPVGSPRRALGTILGHGVRFGWPEDGAPSVIAAGEGIETMLSLRMVLPNLPMIAGLSAGHLSALVLPASLRRLYVALDADKAGRGGMERLAPRAREVGVEVLSLQPESGDWNDDLRRLGPKRLIARLRDQLAPSDAARHLAGS